MTGAQLALPTRLTLAQAEEEVLVPMAAEGRRLAVEADQQRVVQVQLLVAPSTQNHSGFPVQAAAGLRGGWLPAAAAQWIPLVGGQALYSSAAAAEPSTGVAEALLASYCRPAGRICSSTFYFLHRIPELEGTVNFTSLEIS